jgi:hypothetical protein
MFSTFDQHWDSLVNDEKNREIIRTFDIENRYRINKKGNVFPPGCKFNPKESPFSPTKRRWIRVEIKTGKINKIPKIGVNKMSRPQVKRHHISPARDRQL